MKTETLIQPSTSIHLPDWEEIFNFLKGYAVAGKMKNTLIALSVATQLHQYQKRKSGEPYIIHPLQVASSLLNHGIDDDITIAAALLHDVIEDCNIENPYEYLGEKYHLDKDVITIVLLLTKDKDYKQSDPKLEKYYSKIKENKKALIIKISDRANNLSTVDAFTKEKMIRYVQETKDEIFPLCKYGKDYYPEYSNSITKFKYQMVSICESIESLYDIAPIPTSPTNYRKTYLFIQGYAKQKDMKNTLRALPLAEILHEGQKRKCGDPFIIHPLRVCSFLISLGINDDATCAAALLHEIFKHCGFERDDKNLVKNYGLSEEVLELIKLVSKDSRISIDDYYKNLKSNCKAALIKLSNRANTCTRLSVLTENELKEYIKENTMYIYPLCTYLKAYYPEFSDEVINMKSHIASVCRVVESKK